MASAMLMQTGYAMNASPVNAIAPMHGMRYGSSDSARCFSCAWICARNGTRAGQSSSASAPAPGESSLVRELRGFDETRAREAPRDAPCPCSGSSRRRSPRNLWGLPGTAACPGGCRRPARRPEKQRGRTDGGVSEMHTLLARVTINPRLPEQMRDGDARTHRPPSRLTSHRDAARDSNIVVHRLHARVSRRAGRGPAHPARFPRRGRSRSRASLRGFRFRARRHRGRERERARCGRHRS